MKKIISLTLVGALITLFSLNVQFVFAQPTTGKETWSKYPDNSGMKFEDVDSFYDSLDKNQYIEFESAKLSIREKVNFKDINKVLSKAEKYGKTRSSGNGYHPKRQVYVFITVSQDGQKMRTAVFDVETQRPISGTSN
ncbi:hypothetical protein [Peribacillus loiseleuriae]|uniref:hypothetical protein n=1 Tax=Peribacillus loiseleuriae TaxID=1679170 RepID=UPI003D052FA7